MKVLVSGDWHLDCFKIGPTDPETDLDLRVKDFFIALDYMIDYAIKDKVDLFVMNGDLFKGRTSTHHIETLVAERFKKIASHMKLVINLGNHDYTPKQLAYGTYTYSILENFDIDNCEVYIDITHLQFDDTDIVFYPYYDLKRVDYKTNTDLINWVVDKVDSFPLEKDCRLFIGHGCPEGTRISGDWYDNLDVVDEPILPKTLFDKFDMALFSHIHRRHEIPPGDTGRCKSIFHIGSIERVDFSEADDDKGFVIYDTTTKKREWVSTNPRPMTDLKLDLLKIDEFTDPTEFITETILAVPRLEESLVKLCVELTPQSYAQLDHRVVKEALEKSFWHKGPKYDVAKIQTSRIKEITEQLSAAEALEKVMASKEGFSEKDRQQILIRGKGILVGR